MSAGDWVAYLDMAWPDRLLALECDSIEHHLSASAFQRDRERRRRLVSLGWRVLEYTYADVRTRPDVVVDELADHLSRPPGHAGS